MTNEKLLQMRWWAAIHDMALEVLENKWKPLPELRRALNTNSDPWFDLRVWGVAEEKREKIVKNGIPSGEKVFYRKSLHQATLEAGAFAVVDEETREVRWKDAYAKEGDEF